MTTRIGLDKGCHARGQSRMELRASAGNAGHLEASAQRLDPVRETAEPRACNIARLEAGSIVAHLDQEVVAVSRQTHDQPARRGVLHGIRESLADGEVRGALHGLSKTRVAYLIGDLEADAGGKARHPV